MIRRVSPMAARAIPNRADARDTRLLQMAQGRRSGDGQHVQREVQNLDKRGMVPSWIPGKKRQPTSTELNPTAAGLLEAQARIVDSRGRSRPWRGGTKVLPVRRKPAPRDGARLREMQHSRFAYLGHGPLGTFVPKCAPVLVADQAAVPPRVR